MDDVLLTNLYEYLKLTRNSLELSQSVQFNERGEVSSITVEDPSSFVRDVCPEIERARGDLRLS